MKEFQDILRLLFDVIEGIRDARRDDGKVSAFELSGLLLRNAGQLFSAAKGAGGAFSELRAIRAEQMEELAQHFFPDLAASQEGNGLHIQLMSDAIGIAINVLNLFDHLRDKENFLNPPKAKPVLENE